MVDLNPTPGSMTFHPKGQAKLPSMSHSIGVQCPPTPPSKSGLLLKNLSSFLLPKLLWVCKSDVKNKQVRSPHVKAKKNSHSFQQHTQTRIHGCKACKSERKLRGLPETSLADPSTPHATRNQLKRTPKFWETPNHMLSGPGMEVRAHTSGTTGCLAFIPSSMQAPHAGTL